MASHIPSFKRPVEQFVRMNNADRHPSKKPRFDARNPSTLAPDAAEDDAILDADVIGARGQQVRRGAVNIDGYDSDSSNDNFNARAEQKVKDSERARKANEEDENDMFADLEEDFRDGGDSEGDMGRGSGKKKGLRFLNEDEIEGQVKSSKSGGHVSADFSLLGNEKGKRKQEGHGVESSSESEVDDATRADIGDQDEELGAGSKKTRAPKLDAFNMREEQEEGRFDDQGNYVRKAVDPDAKYDLWLEGTSKKEMRKAKEAADKREQERRRRDLEEDAVSIAEVLTRLIPLLQRGETVIEALARLGKGKGKDRKTKRQAKHNQQKRNGDFVDSPIVESAELKRRERVDAITSAADMLLTKGQHEIYDTERELLIRQYRKESGEDWVDPSEEDDHHDHGSASYPAQLWEFRWTDARDGGTMNGPYDSNTMKQWNDAGYFGEGVEFRRVGDGRDWSRVANFA